jgi:hypothetical protein
LYYLLYCKEINNIKTSNKKPALSYTKKYNLLVSFLKKIRGIKMYHQKYNKKEFLFNAKNVDKDYTLIEYIKALNYIRETGSNVAIENK